LLLQLQLQSIQFLARRLPDREQRMHSA
jgi:hypothetical protein